MQELPLVSVILTSYNQQVLLDRALQSLLVQTYPHMEIVIVDDGSVDGSKEYIQKKAEEHPQRIRYHLQTANVGIPKNKNTGFKMAMGDFITYLDGDDTYYPEKVAKEVEEFLKNPALGVVYSGFDFKEFDGRWVKTWGQDPMPQGDIYKEIVLEKFPYQHLHRFEMFRREVMHSLHFYDETFSIYHDLDFMMRYSVLYQVGYCSYVGSSYFMNPSSIVSRTKVWNMREQHKEVFLKHKNLFLEQGLKEEYDRYLLKSDIQQLFQLPTFSLVPYMKAVISQPGQMMSIFKALYFRIRSGNLAQ
jgi:glycosyltransferase involved in cell wall biosynthesis